MMSRLLIPQLLLTGLLAAGAAANDDLRGGNGYAAARSLLAGSPAAALEAFAELAGDPDGERRALAAWGLAQLTTEARAVALLQGLAKDEHAPGAATALQGLGGVTTVDVSPQLSAGLRHRSRAVRLAAVRGIRAPVYLPLLTALLQYEIGLEPEREGTEKLIEVVHWQEADAAVRLATVQALQQLGRPDALPALIQAMERETSFNRLAIATVIESFGTSAAAVCLGRIVPTPYDDTAFKERLPLLMNNGALAVIAGRLDDPRCVPYLMQTLLLPRPRQLDDALTTLLIGTVERLGHFRVERAAGPLTEMLAEATVQELAEALVIALRRIGRPAARHLARHADNWELVNVFLPLLREPELRSAAVLPTLRAFAVHESPEVRLQAARTLGLYIREGLVPEYEIALLESLARDPERDVRQVVAEWQLKIKARFGEEIMQ